MSISPLRAVLTVAISFLRGQEPQEQEQPSQRPIAPRKAAAFTHSDGATVGARQSFIARTPHLSAVSLPAAGAATTSTDCVDNVPYSLDPHVKFLTFWPVYTIGGSGGAVELTVMFGNGTETAPEPVMDENITVNNGNGNWTQGVHPHVYAPTPPPDSNPFSCPPLRVQVPEGATVVWMRAQEVGNTGLPGTVSVALTGIREG